MMKHYSTQTVITADSYDEQGRKIAEESYSGDGGITMGIRYAYVDLT